MLTDATLQAAAAWLRTAPQRITNNRLERGARLVGRKIALASAAVQRQLSVAKPDFGVLFGDVQYASGDTISSGTVLQPRVEAKVAFVLANDLIEGPLELDDVRCAVASAMPAREICGDGLTECGERRLVGGQENMIIDIALYLQSALAT